MNYALSVITAPQENPALDYRLLADLLQSGISQPVQDALIDLAQQEGFGSVVRDALATRQQFEFLGDDATQYLEARDNNVREAFRALEWLNQGIVLREYQRFLASSKNMMQRASETAYGLSIGRSLLEARTDAGHPLISSPGMRNQIQKLTQALQGITEDVLAHEGQWKQRAPRALAILKSLDQLLTICTPGQMARQYQAFRKMIDQTIASIEAKRTGSSGRIAQEMHAALDEGHYEELFQLLLKERLHLVDPEDAFEATAPRSGVIPRFRIAPRQHAAMCHPATKASPPMHMALSMCAQGGMAFCRHLPSSTMSSVVTPQWHGLMTVLFPSTPALFR